MTETPLVLEFLLLFVVAVALAGGTAAIGRRRPGDGAYRAGLAVSLATALLLFWVNGAVGIVGSASNDANAMYAGVLAIGAVGALIARWRPAGLCRTLLAVAVAQVLVGAVALAAGLGREGAAWPWDVIVATAIFTGLWLLAAALFRRSAGNPAAGS
jgi:hypothetical protein